MLYVPGHGAPSNFYPGVAGFAGTREGFARLGECIRTLKLPCVIVQEGGYHLETLDSNAQAFFGSPQVWER